MTLRPTIPRLKLLAKIHRGQVPTEKEAATLRSLRAWCLVYDDYLGLTVAGYSLLEHHRYACVVCGTEEGKLQRQRRRWYCATHVPAPSGHTRVELVGQTLRIRFSLTDGVRLAQHMQRGGPLAHKLGKVLLAGTEITLQAKMGGLGAEATACAWRALDGDISPDEGPTAPGGGA